MKKGLRRVVHAKGRSLLLALALLPLLTPSAFATVTGTPANLSQENSQSSSALTHHQGSEDSIHDATTHAMMAFMNLAALNIGGAISEGYHAYGNYINHNQMNNLDAQSQAAQASMSSAGVSIAGPGSSNTTSAASSGASSSAPASGVTGKGVADMDTSFLYQGETAQVAEQFEQKSGMSRSDFFTQMASGLDANLQWSDPDLVSKLESRYNAFKNSIPNQDFRNGLQSAQDSFSPETRAKMMGEINQFFADAHKGDPNTMLASDAAKAAATAAASVPAAARTPANADGAKAPAAAAPATVTVATGKAGPDREGFFLGMKGENGLKDFFTSGASTSDQDTIFMTVSKRYRMLTPGLTGRTSMVKAQQ